MGGRAIVAMEQELMRLDIMGTAAAAEELTRSAYNELPVITPEEFSYRRGSSRSSKILMQGPLEEDSNRISARSSDKDLCQIM